MKFKITEVSAGKFLLSKVYEYKNSYPVKHLIKRKWFWQKDTFEESIIESEGIEYIPISARTGQSTLFRTLNDADYFPSAQAAEAAARDYKYNADNFPRTVKEFEL